MLEDSKPCNHCGKAFSRPKHISDLAWIARSYCSINCNTQHKKARGWKHAARDGYVNYHPERLEEDYVAEDHILEEFGL